MRARHCRSSACMAQLRHMDTMLHYTALFLVLTAAAVHGDLSFDYYQQSCPNLEAVVRSALAPVFASDGRVPAGFLRLLFHDCQVQGCDASILLDSDPSRGIVSEVESGKNFAVKFRETIGMVKSKVEAVCPGVVSCADLVPLATREGIAHLGGPQISIPLGRKDALTASNLMADDALPSSSIGVDGSLDVFGSKGLNVEETVAILGGHTIGVGHCLTVAPRLYSPEDTDQLNMNADFQAFLTSKCPTLVPTTNATFITNDQTAGSFDNQYFSDVLNGRGLFTIDAALGIDPRTAPYVQNFAADKNYFFNVFSSAFVKLTTAVVLTDGEGEVRTQCNRVNGQ